MRIKILLLISLFLFTVIPAQAQEATPDAPGNFLIFYDEIVQQTITEGGFYDTWRVDAEVGDVIVAYIRASNGLAPFAAILDPGSDVVAESIEGEVNGIISVEWAVVAAGRYTVLATRVGDQYGTTTGDYELEVRNATGGTSTAEVNPLEQATFQCQDFEAVNVLSVNFNEDAGQTDSYRISVYGFDGLQPVIRIYIPTLDLNDCSRDSQFMVGDTLTLPNEMTTTVLSEESHTAARLTLTGVEQMGGINLVIGSAYRTTGRYVLVIEGFNVGEGRDGDFIDIANGPLAAASPLLVYMVRAQGSRVDPFAQTILNDGTLLTCDDAGRRTCQSGVPTFRDSSIIFNEGVSIIGSRFDAGLSVAPALGEHMQIGVTSFEYRTTGQYSIVIVGQLPAITQ
jgi:hypothetical protein